MDNVHLAIKPPVRLELNVEADDALERWLIWLETWTTYAILIDLNAMTNNGPVRTEAYKINLLQHTAGAVFVTLYKKLRSAEDTLQAAIDKVTNHLRPNLTKSLAVTKFREMCWNTYETIDAYYDRLHSMASNSCDFGDSLDREIIQQIISKSNDRELTRDLIKMPDDKTLQDVLKMCRLHASIKAQTSPPVKQLTTAAIRGQLAASSYKKGQAYRSGAANVRPPTRSSSGRPKNECWNCGGEFPHVQRCPMVRHQCEQCGRMGHAERYCWGRRKTSASSVSPRSSRESTERSKSHSVKRERSPNHREYRNRKSRRRSDRLPTSSRKKNRHRTRTKSKTSSSADSDTSTADESEEEYDSKSKTSIGALVLQPMPIQDLTIWSIATNVLNTSSQYTNRVVSINDFNVNMMIDSGSPVNLIDEQTFRRLASTTQLCGTDLKIYGYGAVTPIPLLGQAKVKLKTEMGEVNDMVFVSVANSGNVLSLNTAKHLKLVSEDWIQKSSALTRVSAIGFDIQKQYPNVFSGKVGCLRKYRAILNINKDAVPVRHNFRPVPYHQRAAVDAELDRMVEAGIIEEALEPSEWIMPLVVVTKDNGTLRLCTDGRAMKEAILRTKHPPVTVNDVKHKLSGAKWFTKIDLKNGYYQIKLDRDSRKFTTFAPHRGLYRYKRLNMGISCSSEIFQHEISKY